MRAYIDEIPTQCTKFININYYFLNNYNNNNYNKDPVVYFFITKH